MDLSRFDIAGVPGATTTRLRDEILSTTVVQDGGVFMNINAVEEMLKVQAVNLLRNGNVDGALGIAAVAQMLLDIQDARLSED